MIEKEAREKLCPINSIHARIVGGMMAKDGVREDILENNLKNIYCKASDCAMWQWNNFPEMEDTERSEKSSHGHCGLAK